MRGTLFYKMTGSGNDFVVLDGRFTSPDRWPAERIRAICDRRTGVGADGFVILTPATAEGVRMAYWNSDGSHGAMCGNAALCSGRISVDLELVPPGEFCLLTDAGLVQVRSRAQGDEAEIKLPDCQAPAEVAELVAGPGEQWIAFGTVGVPHLVVRVSDVNQVDVLDRGRTLRSDVTLGPAGANVNFVSRPAGPDSPWLIRTFERGVEGETLACGTGTVAAGLALARRGETPLPATFRSRGGPHLVVKATLKGTSATDVWLGGQGRLLFRGVWEAR
ncbi:MAG TPA: diaminopimelate epimerase [Gemmatimonadales bacterium]